MNETKRGPSGRTIGIDGFEDECVPVLALDEHGHPVLLAASEPVGPTVVEPIEIARRMDVVREAAREFEDLSDQDVRERLRGLTSRELEASEVAIFRQDVRDQVLDDLVDILHWAHKGRLRTRRMVRVVAPKGYVRKAVHGLAEDEFVQVQQRLRALGWGEVEMQALHHHRGAARAPSID